MLTYILRLENDTEKVNRLYTQGLELTDKNPQLASLYAEHCESIAKKNGSLKHVSKAYNLSGILSTKYGNYKKALLCFENHLGASQKLNDALGFAFGLTNLGNIYLRLNQFQKAEEYFLSAVEKYNALGNKTEVANGLINLGALKHQLNQLDAAYENYEKALQTGKELNNYEIKAICLNNIAQIFLDKGNYEKALAYNYDALELRELMGLDVDVSDSYLSIAEVALKQKNIDLAEENLDLASNLCDRLAYHEGKMTCHQLASELYALKINYQLAYENLKLYNQLKDSLTLLQHEEPAYVENEKPVMLCPQEPVKNLWMLIVLCLLAVVIPFTLFRLKR
jgi:tetratricopeptide (TPR) repeat protein